MSPLLHLLLLTTLASPSTPPATIEHQTTTTERSTTTMPSIPYPERHPNQPTGRMNREDAIRAGITFPGNQAGHGYPTPGTNPIANEGRSLTPTEHTSRPR